MNLFLLILIVFITIGLVTTLVFSVLNKNVSGIKIMLLGINLTLIGGVMALDKGYNHGGVVYFIAIAGLIISLIGLMKKD
jgi:hypothetical protein